MALMWNRTVDWDADDWRRAAACRNTEPDLFFPVGTTGPAVDQIDAASKPAAEREYQMLLTLAQKDQPALTAITMQDRNFYFEQLRKTAFDFDSQSARPYFPYDRVQQGILDVASKLFNVTFRPAKDAVVWDPSVDALDVFERCVAAAAAHLAASRIFFTRSSRAICAVRTASLSTSRRFTSA